MKPSFFSLSRLVLMFIALFSSASCFAQFSGAGSGNGSDPYLIFTAKQLDEIRNGFNTGAYYKLMNDIDLAEFISESEQNTWVPIDNFHGRIDGNGKKITGLVVNGHSYAGLFRDMARAVIENLTIEGSIQDGGQYVGGFAGYSSNSSLKNCCFKGKIEGDDYVGGLIGSGTQCAIKGCSAEGSIKGCTNLGGIVGYCKYTSIENCITTEYIIDDDRNEYHEVANIGGIAGCTNWSQLCQNAANAWINAEFSTNVGGIVGGFEKGDGKIDETTFVSPPLLRDCSFTGILMGKNVCGGIAGSTDATIINCYANGILTSKNRIAGIADDVQSFNNPYANPSLRNNISLSPIIVSVLGDSELRRISPSQLCKGNLALSKLVNEGEIVDLKAWDLVYPDVNNGYSIKPTEATQKSTYFSDKMAEGYSKWDFQETWAIQEGESYPYQQWQTAPPKFQAALCAGDRSISGTCPEDGTIYIQIGDNIYTGSIIESQWTISIPALQSGVKVIAYSKNSDKQHSNWVMQTVKYDGEGTLHQPYLIATAEDLANICEKGYYKLKSDIDLSGSAWAPIVYALADSIFIDGNGHKISRLIVNRKYENMGLFGIGYNASIKNLVVEAQIIPPFSELPENAGGIVGIGKRLNLQQCAVTGDIRRVKNVGGLVGTAKESKISESYVDGTFDAGAPYCGGLVGQLKDNSSINDCVSNSNIEEYFGKGDYCAGIVALNTNSTINRCYAMGKVSSYHAAGLCARNSGAYAKLSNSFAITSQITGEKTGTRVLGGLLEEAPIPENNYALKTMKVTVGYEVQKFYDDYSYNYDPMQGHAKTNEQLMQRTTYESRGWDFNTIWGIDEGKGYPYLKWMKGNVNTGIQQVLTTNEEDKATITPSRGMVTISCMRHSLPVAVYNLSGLQVYQGTVNGNLSVRLVSGAYIVVVGSQKRKVVL